MSGIDLIPLGIIVISLIGLGGCIISLMLERKLWKIKSEIWWNEYVMRVRAQMAIFDILKNKKYRGIV